MADRTKDQFLTLVNTPAHHIQKSISSMNRLSNSSLRDQLNPRRLQNAFLQPAPKADSPVTPGHGFGQFYRCSRFSDVTLIDAAGNRLASHRLVLSAKSRRFDELLSRNGEMEVCCTDIQPNCLHTMLEYLYTNHCSLQMRNAVQLLSAAIHYGCDELESTASLYIHMQLNVNTCCFFFSEAQAYKVEHVAIKALYVASLDFQNAIRSQSFFDLTLENLTAMLASPKLGGIRKVALYKAGCAWVLQDSKRLENFKDIVMCIQARPSATPSDTLHLLHLLNVMNTSDDQKSASDEMGDEMAWTSAGSSEKTDPASAFLAKLLADPELRQASTQSITCPSPYDRFPSRPISSEIKSDDGDISTDTARLTNTRSHLAQFNERVKKLEMTMKPVEAGDSAKERPMEDNTSSEASSARKPKGRRGRAQKCGSKSGQPFMCQVEGCTANLQDLKDYHIRYKICNYHLKVKSIMKDGQQQRFCQQCGRFHPLEKFDNIKRSCRERLQRHNLRRRKRLSKSNDSKPEEILAMPSVGLPSQHLVYFSTGARETDAHSTNVEKLYANGHSRCYQFLSPAEMDRYLMLSPVPQSMERDPSPPQKLERAHTVATDSEANSASHRPSYVKPDPGTGRIIGSSSNSGM